MTEIELELIRLVRFLPPDLKDRWSALVRQAYLKSSDSMIKVFAVPDPSSFWHI
ncbi:MAG: hypothetical protein JW991_01860 [Candidatus Pacebacteria bacterium]|nr:hypothetical protein [Candidatus Paceibacterota bacterium]